MHRTLPDGCSVLVDRQRTELLEGKIFLVRTGDGLVVKRAQRDREDGWRLVSEHRSWPPLPWDESAVPIGQVVWMARALV